MKPLLRRHGLQTAYSVHAALSAFGSVLPQKLVIAGHLFGFAAVAPLCQHRLPGQVFFSVEGLHHLSLIHICVSHSKLGDQQHRSAGVLGLQGCRTARSAAANDQYVGSQIRPVQLHRLSQDPGAGLEQLRQLQRRLLPGVWAHLQGGKPVSYTHLDVYKRQRRVSSNPTTWVRNSQLQ